MTTDPAPGSVLSTPPRRLRFGVFEMDLRAGELRRSGRLVRIQPQPFKVLTLLASRPDDVITREELQAELWPAGTFVDFEQSLNFCIKQVRAALGDNAVRPRYVETLPRRGYRWVGGPVERLGMWPHPEPHGGGHVARFPRAIDVDEAEGAAGAAPADRSAPSAGEPPRTTRGVRPSPAVAILALVALCSIGIALYLALRRPEPASAPAYRRLTFRRGFVTSARFAPDGRIVYGASWEGEPPRLHVVESDPRDSRILPIGDRVVGASSSEVAYLEDGVLARAPLAGGPAKPVLRDVFAADATPDGSDYAVVRRADGRPRLEFPLGRVVAGVPRADAVRISPDRRHLALTVHPRLDDDRGAILVYDLSGRRVAASEEWSSLEGLAWSPANDEVWFTASRAGADNALHALALDGTVRLVLAGTGRLVLHDVDRDGRALLEHATLRSQMMYRREGSAEDLDLSWLDVSGAAALSRDGSEILFYESGQGGGADYTSFIRRTDGSAPVRIGNGLACSLSPDGQWVLIASLRQPDHVEMLPTGPGEARTLRIPGGGVHEMAGFLPDGKTIYVTIRDAAGQRTSWLVDASGANPRRLELPEGRALVGQPFSADGTRTVMTCPGRREPCFVPLDGGAPVPVEGARPGWAAVGWDAGGRLYFRELVKVPVPLWRLDPSTGHAEKLADLAPRDRAGVHGIARILVSGDGRSWAYTAMRRLSDLDLVTGLR